MGSHKIRCRRCKDYTNHKIVSENIEKWEEHRGETRYQIVECLGCDTKSYRTMNIDGESEIENDYGEYEPSVTETIYPPFVEVESEVKTFRLPEPVKTIFEQTLNAINISNNTLTAIGLRATLEAVCLDQKIRPKNLEMKINELHKKGIVSVLEKDRLHAIRFLGNDAAHDLAFPDKEKLIAALKIIEHILLSVYIMDKEAEWYLDYPLTKEAAWLEIISEKANSMNAGDTIDLNKLLGKNNRKILDKTAFQAFLVQKIADSTITNLKTNTTTDSNGKQKVAWEKL